MAFEKIKENTDELQDRAKEYIDANIAYYKLYGFKIAMKSTTLMLKLFLLGIMLVIVTLFFSIALALAIGYGLDNFAYGFLIVGGIYFVLAILVYYVQDKIVEGPILRTFSKMLFKKY
ncbi:competence protein [Flavobacterium macacae]|uniref:Competence protein n=1 Tax=Flavobacterium macacae TaxID=2488993 RepID=A0A3P3WIE9_9FLAO|nr:competence protein [Flavobacterium macacae]RRJ94166.1 competence protein [Flavobacterium macacae]